MRAIDLNADLGEGVGEDEALLDVVSSASIACGGHAGDRETMARVLASCRRRGIRTGAHPGFADRENFGRKRLEMPLDAVAGQVASQLRLFATVAAEVGTPVAYVKLHGAMANIAAEDLHFARAVLGAAAEILPGVAVLALDNSAQVEAAQSLALPVIREAYADRAYTPDGLLVSRSLTGAVIEETDDVVARCVRLARAGKIVAIDGSVLHSDATSICLHGDTPGALDLARAIKGSLEEAGVAVRATA